MGGCRKWQLWLLWLTGVFGSLSSLPVAQNPMETFGAAAMTAMSSMADIASNGAAARNEKGISSEFFKATTKSEMGVGKAMADDRRRRKRHAIQMFGDESLLPLNNAAHPHQHRGKRSPCYTFPGYGGGGGYGVGGTGAAGTGGTAQIPNPVPVGDGSDFTDIAERKRKQRKRNAAQQRKKTRSTSKKTKRKLVSRRRRQAESPEGDFFDETGKRISHVVGEFSNTAKSFVGSMMTMANAVHKSFKDIFGEPQKV